MRIYIYVCKYIGENFILFYLSILGFNFYYIMYYREGGTLEEAIAADYIIESNILERENTL